MLDMDGSSEEAARRPMPQIQAENASHRSLQDTAPSEDAKADGQQQPASAGPGGRRHSGHTEHKQAKGPQMGRDARWDELLKNRQEQDYAKEQLDNKNDVKARWRRGLRAAARLQAGEAIHSSNANGNSDDKGGNAEAGPSRQDRPQLDEKTKKERRARFWGKLTLPAGKERDEGEELPFASKALEQQHWLEMIDGKHRYGSNLKFYFREWKEADTKDNFFRWLDRGEGQHLDLEELPRKQLEKEVITYLSAEQRLNYLTRIDPEGRIRWVRNGELVDTAAGTWRDSGDGTGVVRDESAGPSRDGSEDEDEDDSDAASSASSASYGTGSELQENEATHYDEYNAGDEGNWLERKVKGITPGGIKKELLRKTLKGNTWIYASDMKMNLFVGIKQSGTFQHSSFTAGGKVTSAGVIVVKQGVIRKLNPLSGHYRSTIDHYRAFIAQLEANGADLSHVKVGKSVMTMWGLSKYTAVTKGQVGVIEDFKRMLHLKHEPNEMEKSAELKKRAEAGDKGAMDEQESKERKE